MIYIKQKNWILQYMSWDKAMSQSEYNKANIEYSDFVKVPVTKQEKQIREITTTNKDGEIFVVAKDTFVATVSVTETIVVEENGEEVKIPLFETVEVKKTYNPYVGYVIIPDDAVVLTEEEYNKEIEKFKSPFETSLFQQYLEKGLFVVNITTENKNKIATIHSLEDWHDHTAMQFDSDRWDIQTENKDIAQKYTDIVNESSLEEAMKWYSSL